MIRTQSSSVARHTVGMIGAAIMLPVTFDAEEFFRKKAAERGGVRYTMDVHDILHRRIRFLPNTGMCVHTVMCGADSSDEEMRRFISSGRFFNADEAVEFLVAALEWPYSEVQLSRTHPNILYLSDGTALRIEWFEQRKVWNIDLLRRSFGTWHIGDCFFSRFDIAGDQVLAA